MDKKYVSVSELRKLLGIPSDGQCTGCQFVTLHGCKDDSLRRACEAIDDAEEAHVVEIVRCEDCKEFQANHHWCGFLKTDIDHDEFCSYGERRADNG